MKKQVCIVAVCIFLLLSTSTPQAFQGDNTIPASFFEKLLSLQEDANKNKSIILEKTASGSCDDMEAIINLRTQVFNITSAIEKLTMMHFSYEFVSSVAENTQTKFLESVSGVYKDSIVNIAGSRHALKDDKMKSKWKHLLVADPVENLIKIAREVLVMHKVEKGPLLRD